MLKKSAKRLLIILLIAVIAEVTIFQSSYWIMKLQKVETNIQYSIESFEKEGWKITENGLISKGGQHLYLRNVNADIKTIYFSADIMPSPDYILMFYTEDKDEIFTDEKSILIQNNTSVNVDKNICALRLDISNVEGLEVTDISIIINRAVFDFSLSRVIAILLIYLCAKGLFYLQRPTLYKIDE